ncbi:hypothetical protein RRG08_007551 [Elysia crispata]|uniref:Uncharacterized protein n=1 Tax=Elysia crispata TaxID=231223 RepID=A0AAE0YEW4_9GAST|nr:hypothetical protein RRG08_007551 [Elysia crispata]
MWQYLWAHAIFHMVRWFPPSNRIKITVVTMVITMCLLSPQFYVLLLNRTTRWCPEPLLSLLIISIVLTFFVIGFTFLFVTMIPVPREVKIAFHVFGLANFCTGLAQCISTLKGKDCQFTTIELYDISVALAVLSAIATVFVVFMLPFWIVNEKKKDSVLDRRNRTGICYEPVKCCSCLWHI